MHFFLPIYFLSFPVPNLIFIVHVYNFPSFRPFYLTVPFLLHSSSTSSSIHFLPFALHYRTHSYLSYHLSTSSCSLNDVDSYCNRLATSKIVLVRCKGRRDLYETWMRWQSSHWQQSRLRLLQTIAASRLRQIRRCEQKTEYRKSRA